MTFDDGMRLFKSGDYSGAAHEFVGVTEKDENNHKAWNALGICLSKTGEYETAATCFENALAIAPDNATYKKNQVGNEKKRQAEPDLSLDDGPAPHISKPKISEIAEIDVGRAPFWLGLIGFIIGIGVSFFLIAAGGVLGAFGVSGSNMIGGRGWLLIILCVIGLASVFVRHKKYGGLILIISGLLILIATGGFGIITGLLFLIAGVLIIRKVGFDPIYYLNFREDLAKKSIFTVIIVLSLLMTLGAMASPSPSYNSNNEIIKNSEASGLKTTSQLDVLPTPDISPKLEKYTIYAAQPTHSKSGILIWDFDPSTDEYLYEFTIYLDANGGYQADRSKANWGKRGFVEAMGKVQVGKINPDQPFEKYGYTYYPEA
jgi:hypothetical protein